MKGRTLSILGIFAAVAGVILIVCKDMISVSGVTITGGILFVAVGLVNLLFFSNMSKNGNSTGRVLTLISNAAAIVLGVSMLVFSATFNPLITFIFGLLVAVCALWQFFVLALGARPYQLPAWLYIFPVLLAVGAVYIFMLKPDKGDAILMLSTGVSFAVLGVACLIEGSALGIARRNFEHSHRQDTPAIQETAISTTAQPRVEQPATRQSQETTEDLDDEIK